MATEIDVELGRPPKRRKNHRITRLQVNEVSLVTDPAILLDEEVEAGMGFPIIKIDASSAAGVPEEVLKAIVPRENEEYHDAIRRLVNAARLKLQVEDGFTGNAHWYGALSIRRDHLILADVWADLLRGVDPVYKCQYTQDDAGNFEISEITKLYYVLQPAEESEAKSVAGDLSIGVPDLALEDEDVLKAWEEVEAAADDDKKAKRKDLPPAAYAAPWFDDGKGGYKAGGKFLPSKSKLPHHFNTVKGGGEDSSIDKDRLRLAIGPYGVDRANWKGFPSGKKEEARTHLQGHAKRVFGKKDSTTTKEAAGAAEEKSGMDPLDVQVGEHWIKIAPTAGGQILDAEGGVIVKLDDEAKPHPGEGYELRDGRVAKQAPPEPVETPPPQESALAQQVAVLQQLARSSGDTFAFTIGKDGEIRLQSKVETPPVISVSKNADETVEAVEALAKQTEALREQFMALQQKLAGSASAEAETEAAPTYQGAAAALEVKKQQVNDASGCWTQHLPFDKLLRQRAEGQS